MGKDGKSGGRNRDNEPKSEYEEVVIAVNRTAAVIKGGRRFSFNAVVAIGNRAGYVGVGFGKAREYADAVQKAIKDAGKKMERIHLKGTTIPHFVKSKFSASQLILKPACDATGIIASNPVRVVCELAGISNILTKSYGSNNPINLAKATLKGLKSLRSKSEVMRLRGVKL